MQTPTFDETQRPPVWLWASIGAVIGGTATILAVRGDLDPVELMLAIAVSAALAALVRMRTTVTPDGLRIAMLPFPRKRVAAKDIASCEVVDYRPLAHYGGWGWRWSPTRGWAYTMRGNRGVMVHERTGKSFLVGSQRPEDLAAAIASTTETTRDPRSGA